MCFPEEGVDVVSARVLIALAFKCDDDTGLAICSRQRVDVAFERNDVYPGKLIPMKFVHVRSLISRDVLSVMFRTHMLLASRSPRRSQIL